MVNSLSRISPGHAKQAIFPAVLPYQSENNALRLLEPGGVFDWDHYFFITWKAKPANSPAR